jgi:hypothetical protein
MLKELHAFEALMQDGIEGHPASDEELHFVPASSGAPGIAFSECLAISGGAHMTHDDDDSSH